MDTDVSQWGPKETCKDVLGKNRFASLPSFLRQSVSNESFSFAYIDGTEPFSRQNLLKSTGVPISTLLLKHDASKCSEHKAKYSIGRPVVHFCSASFRKVCIEMSGVLEWFLQFTLFGRLQHSTVS